MAKQSIGNPAIDYIRDRLKVLGVKQSDVATALGVIPQALNSLLTDKRALTFLDVALLEAVGVVEADELIAREMEQMRELARGMVREGGISQAQAARQAQQRAAQLRRELRDAARLRQVPLEELERMVAALPPAQAQAGAGSVFALSGSERNPDQGGEAL